MEQLEHFFKTFFMVPRKESGEELPHSKKSKKTDDL